MNKYAFFYELGYLMAKEASNKKGKKSPSKSRSAVDVGIPHRVTPYPEVNIPVDPEGIYMSPKDLAESHANWRKAMSQAGEKYLPPTTVMGKTKRDLDLILKALFGEVGKGERLKTLARMFSQANVPAKAIAAGVPTALLAGGGYGAYKALKPKSKKEKILEALGLD